MSCVEATSKVAALSGSERIISQLTAVKTPDERLPLASSLRSASGYLSEQKTRHCGLETKYLTIFNYNFSTNIDDELSVIQQRRPTIVESSSTLYQHNKSTNRIIFDPSNACLYDSATAAAAAAAAAHESQIWKLGNEDDNEKESNSNLNLYLLMMSNQQRTSQYEHIDRQRLQLLVIDDKKICAKTNRNKLIIFLITLLCLKNAPLCSSFGDIERHHDSNLVKFNYRRLTSKQPPVPNNAHNYLTSPSSNNAAAGWIRQPRSFVPLPPEFNDPLVGIMSNPMGSLSQDDQADSNSPRAESWTSMLTNQFGMPNNDTLDAHIRAILIPRVSGTPGNVQVRQYIEENLRKNNFHVENDVFTSNTPIGEINFSNIIASSNPEACRQLVLACHYDSKMMNGFLGATDSAVPCAMLLKLAETFNKSFRPTGDGNPANDLGLRFIFFDGEEAFVQWTATDSLYGSRHLAAKWDKQAPPSQCKLGRGKTELDRIELFVLLDLIGAKDTSFVMYSTRLKHHYEALQSYEKAHLLRDGFSTLQARRNMAFKGRTMPIDFVEDDHVPFKKRGVPILLLLAHPFPQVWHRVEDDYSAIDFPKTKRILHVLEEFVSNYSKRVQ